MIPCLVDAHVHLYDVFDPARLADSAAANVARLAASAGLPAATPGILLLAQTAAERPAAAVFDPAPKGWTATRLDAGAVRLDAPGRPPLVLVPGCQTATSEGLEVLALGTGARIADGMTARETILAAAAAGALPVLPYGVGKWSGARGATVGRLAADAELSPLVLGDNAGRPARGGRPPQFAAAEAAGRIVLPGTDPLPFAGEAAKVARLVFAAEADPDDPWPGLKDWILRRTASPAPLGDHEGIGRFVALQAAMQLRKRLRRR